MQKIFTFLIFDNSYWHFEHSYYARTRLFNKYIIYIPA